MEQRCTLCEQPASYMLIWQDLPEDTSCICDQCVVLLAWAVDRTDIFTIAPLPIT